jgi:U32 family peptidase
LWKFVRYGRRGVKTPLSLFKEYKMKEIKKPELMAPAGDWTMLNSAINAGADAVYFGVDKLNMRAKAANFQVSELREISELCKGKGVKTYLTLNTIIYQNELDEADEIIIAAKEAGIDMIICWDMAIIMKCRKHGMKFCISTQASVSNGESARMYKELGAARVVPARECSLEQIKEIVSEGVIEVETFIHGAMCIAVSGRCFMSHHLFGKSANRGECIQPCRREYEVFDSSIKKGMVMGEDYIMSHTDLCTIEFIDKLIEAGIDSFKIEGRKRSPEYIATTVSVYRRGIDLYFEGKLSREIKKELLRELEEVYNRGFSSGFYFEVPSSADYANIYGSKATTQKEYLGRVVNYYKKAEMVYVELEAGEVNVGDSIYIIGPTTGVVQLVIGGMKNEDSEAVKAIKGERVTIPCTTLCRVNDKVYIIKKIVIPPVVES